MRANVKKHRHRPRKPKPRITKAAVAHAEQRGDEPSSDAYYHGGAPGVGVGDAIGGYR